MLFLLLHGQTKASLILPISQVTEISTTLTLNQSRQRITKKKMQEKEQLDISIFSGFSTVSYTATCFGYITYRTVIYSRMLLNIGV
jgi:hypothetical protein